VGGCFIKDTPVLMANKNHPYSLKNAGLGLAMAAMPMVSAVPIQDVQLLDYAVAHTTVNSHGDKVQDRLLASADDTYDGLMGAKPTTTNDPYTSDQQRQRDQYLKKQKDGSIFKNKNGEKWPHWLGKNPDIGVSGDNHLLFRSAEDKTKIWNTFDDAAKWIE